MRAFAPAFSFRALFEMVVALAVIFAPAISRGEALAAVPNHDMQMMETGHCHSPASKHAGHHHGEMSCCTAMWVGGGSRRQTSGGCRRPGFTGVDSTRGRASAIPWRAFDTTTAISLRSTV
jgi:hypothetical protein